MKFFAFFLLITLTAYIAMPTIALIIEKSTDIICIDEIEKEKESEKELKLEFDCTTQLTLQTLNYKKIAAIIISSCNFKHEIISSKIFIPPPDLSQS